MALAALTSEPSLKPRYADLAESYKRLAAERERLINQGIIPADE